MNIKSRLSENTNRVTEEKLREVSDLYENQFIREMIKQMRATVHEGGFIKQNNAEKIFRSQLDEQYADQWGKAGGIGLSDIIYDQLMAKYGEKIGLRTAIEKPQGPLDFNQKSIFAGVVSRPASVNSANNLLSPTTFKLQAMSGTEGQVFDREKNQLSAPVFELKNPWAGILLDKKYSEMDQMQYRIKHDNGLESLILMRGTGLGAQLDEHKLSLGDVIQTGQQLGWASTLSPLFWTVKPNVSE